MTTCPALASAYVGTTSPQAFEPADFERFEHAVALQVRMLDNVLELTHWPLPQQAAQAQAKRRIGVGFTGMGNTLAMLCLRYDAPDGREMAARIAAVGRVTVSLRRSITAMGSVLWLNGPGSGSCAASRGRAR